jgi:hypothetical protein
MLCQFCGVEAPTKYVSFHQNIGMLVMRQSRSVSGTLCKSCIHSNFWKLSGTTFFLGWWGAHSMIITPFLLLNNVCRYLFCLAMEPVPPGACPPELTDADIERLHPHTEDILNRLQQNEDFASIANDISRLTGRSPGQVAIYTQSVIETLQQQPAE